MRCVIGSDHGGFELKEKLKAHLETRGYEVVDVGTHSADSVDYPSIAELACQTYLDGDFSFGVLVCGTGIGISMAANKVDGIRCALIHNTMTAALAREHNNANFVALGGRVDYAQTPETILDAFVDAEFEGDRHARRVAMIMALEDSDEL